MDISSVKFIKSSPDLKSCPKPGYPEYAFAGRSNVGKSSLINMLVNLKKLAKTSSMPGKTRLINHYLVNDRWYLVDLPGYGYARGGKQTQDSFLAIMGEYLTKRETLACLFLLVDCRHKPFESDLNVMEWMGMHGIPFSLVFTKTDKISPSLLKRNLGQYKATLLKNWEEMPMVFTTSTLRISGREQILDFINTTSVNI